MSHHRPTFADLFGVREKNVPLVAGVVVVIMGVFLAWQLRWLCDDIFITFRYVDQWMAGNGIVYNPGERVEGYTHPLWLVLLSGWKLAGFELPTGAMALGLVSFGMVLGVTAFVSSRLSSHWWSAWSPAALALALHYDSRVWATGGLETSLFTLLFTASVLIPVLFRSDSPRVLFACGSCLTLAILTRPEAVLLIPVLLVFFILKLEANGETRRKLVRTITPFFLPLVAVMIPYAVWKLLYYGDLLPNTYYAKSAGGLRYMQGFVYLWMYVKGYPTSLFLLLVPLAAWKLKGNSGNPLKRIRQIVSEPRGALLFLGASSLGIYILFFVARVGGDFMYARFLIPLVPIAFLSVETAVRVFAESKKWILVAVLIALPLSVGTVDASVRERLFLDDEGKQLPVDRTFGIIDEHWFWTHTVTDDGKSLLELMAEIGKAMRKYFDGLHVRILSRGQLAMVYHAQPSEVIENFGLTDAYIAHGPATEARIGHEKVAPLAYVLSRRVHFFFPFIEVKPVDTSFYRIALFKTPHAWVDAEIFVYEAPLMKELRRRFPDDIQIVDFESYLDGYLATSSRRPKEEIERDYHRFRLFYFYHNPDSVREDQFKQLISRN